jgi:predicted RNase H-like HicB family nuclease
MSYGGRTECKLASGETREEALRTATEAACALVASGVTETQNCVRSAPQSVTWLEKKE